MKEFKLENEPKITSGFKIPDGYFDGLQSKIDQRLTQKEKPVISIFSRRKTWITIVAAMLIVALGIPFLNYFNTPTNDIDKTTLENYLTSHTDITNDDIAELLDEDDIQKIKIDLKVEDRELEEILTADINIEEYIID